MKWHRIYPESERHPESTIYYYRMECEHSGDVEREERKLKNAGAEVVDIDVEDVDGDGNFFATMYFRILDRRRFEEMMFDPDDEDGGIGRMA